MFRRPKSGFWGEDGAGHMSPVVVGSRFEGLARGKVFGRVEFGRFANRTQYTFVFLALAK